jgi:amidophosphoribosyltransferase
MNDFEGAYSDVAIYDGELYALRDLFGVRPLVWGENNELLVFASESIALDIINVPYKGDIDGGLLAHASKNGMDTKQLVKKQNKHCMFEYVYFSRPDSIINGKYVGEVRQALGEHLAEESPAKCDVVIEVPDTSRNAAIAYARKLGIRHEEGLIKNRYIGRTFIMPCQEKRREAVRLKLNPIRNVIDGKRVALIDDSIVRATTMKEMVSILRNGGAKEVHIRITCPPIVSPCFYGVDIPTYSELIASSKSVEEIRKFIAADSLAYLSINGLKKAIGLEICEGCIANKYNTPFVQKIAGEKAK